MSLIKKIGSFGLGLFALYNINCAKEEAKDIKIIEYQTIKGIPTYFDQTFCRYGGIIGIKLKKNGEYFIGIMMPGGPLETERVKKAIKKEINDWDREEITLMGYWDKKTKDSDESDTIDYFVTDTLIVEGEKISSEIWRCDD